MEPAVRRPFSRFNMHDPALHQHSARSPAGLAPSLLRLSVMQRAAIAAALAAVLWVAVACALSGIAP
jgi:hypothetical protein